MRALVIAMALVASIGCTGSPLGAGCSATEPCASPLVCGDTETPGVRVCMNSCEVVPVDAGLDATVDAGVPSEPPRLCNDGTVCIGEEGSHVCYLGGTTPYHMPCTAPLECEAGTTCSPDRMLCEQVCTVGVARGPCAEDEVCVPVGGGICRRVEDADCDAETCMGALVCAATERAEESICSEPCGVSRLCTFPCRGAICVDAACLTVGEVRVCYHGGSRSIGAACTTSLECATGALCSSDRHVCEQACIVDVIGCPENQTCVAVDGGLCRAI